MTAGGNAGEWPDKEPQKRLWGRLPFPHQPSPRRGCGRGAILLAGQVGRSPLPRNTHARAHKDAHQKPWGLCSNLLGCPALLRGLSLPTCKTSSLPQAEQKGEKVESQNPGLTVTWQDLGKLRPDPD